MNSVVKVPIEFVKGIKELSIDASSIIYLLKIGLLGSLSAEIKLLATSVIIEEVGFPHLPIQALDIDNKDLTNDQSVVELARIKQIPVLSEDQEVLKNAESNGLQYYNTLMMLNYLFFKKRLTEKNYPEYLCRLIGVAHYSSDILAYGEEMFKKIRAL